MTDPREFSCMDDCPENNGWGYYQRGREEDPEEQNTEDENEEED